MTKGGREGGKERGRERRKGGGERERVGYPGSSCVQSMTWGGDSVLNLIFASAFSEDC